MIPTKILWSLLVLAALCLSGASSEATPPSTISNSVAVCDPNNPQNCSQPSSTGNVPTASPNITPLPPGQYTPVSDAASTALTVPTGATYAVVCAEVANHRFTWDGSTTPTASIGTQLVQPGCVQLSGALMLAAFRIITQTAGGVFTVSYGK